MLASRFDRSRELSVSQQRKAASSDSGHGSLKLPAIHHGESIDARMNQETFEAAYARFRQRGDVFLVVGHHAAPKRVVDHALPARRGLLGAQILDRRGGREI